MPIVYYPAIIEVGPSGFGVVFSIAIRLRVVR